MAKPMTHATLADRVVWTLCLGAATGIAGLLAARAASWGWHRFRGEPPPEPIGLMTAFAKKAGVRAASSFRVVH
jgi:hypothetical protein